MQNHFTFKAALLVAAMLALPVAQAAMARADYSAGKTRINADYKVDKAACKPMTANAKDVCMQEAKGKEKVARAELKYAYTGKYADQNDILVTKAKAAYAVAKERCDDKAGNDKSVCVSEAKSVEIRALADAKMANKISAARKDDASEKLTAEYNVAVQKCEALAGEPKSACITSAKTQYGKM